MAGLIDNLKQGDASAFSNMVNTCKDMVYNTAIGILQQAEDAEDVTQEVFIQAYESMSSFKGESSVSTWLYRITVTKSLDHLRRKTRKKRWAKITSLFGLQDAPVPEPADFEHPGVTLANKERSTLLFRAVARLPENQKAVFVLHKLEGLPAKEIAAVMDISLASVEGLMHRAKANLREQLEKYYKS
ncbi:RNA polymerase sigma factor [Chitinophaga sedimenti]|uniref:RNA polymerase sigma factor n=1 Tax=Chitinophaga sedimenti TaxID=2033606 RepID=UPI0020030784|nr:RNA polymerase sigma factor [Chitinophaga sedimenti]MCK7556418.1 RNA polymerase sigma factor [Chitinophaga sedimenti]